MFNFFSKSSSSIVEKADDVTTKNDYSSNWLDEKDKKNLLPNNQKADLEPTFDSGMGVSVAITPWDGIKQNRILF